jgi:4-alpha-glucanotransferase
MVPMQDILGLDSSARMNTPATQVIIDCTLLLMKSNFIAKINKKQSGKSLFSLLSYPQKGNWRWRIPSCVSFDSLSSEAAQLKELLAMYNRM